MMGREIRKLRQSFAYAVRGIGLCMESERNFRIHVTAALYVTLLAWIGRLPATQCAILALCFGVMMGAELMNTAIECLCDWKASGYDRTVRDAKDIAAAAVFVCAIACAVIGLIFFVPVAPHLLHVFLTHPTALTGLLLSVPCALWFIFRFGRKK